jgi:hypothetical protein
MLPAASIVCASPLESRALPCGTDGVGGMLRLMAKTSMHTIKAAMVATLGS